LIRFINVAGDPHIEVMQHLDLSEDEAAALVALLAALSPTTATRCRRGFAP
jgi:hypothetical protein